MDYSEPQKGEAEDHFTSDQLSRYVRYLHKSYLSLSFSFSFFIFLCVSRADLLFSLQREESAMMQGTMADLEFDDLEGEQDVEGDKPKAKGLFSFFSNLAGGVISREDLDPVMKKV